VEITNTPALIREKSALRNGLAVPEGKYCLVDAGYALSKGFLTLYRGLDIIYESRQFPNYGKYSITFIFIFYSTNTLIYL